MKNDAGFGGLGLAGKFSRLFLGTTLKDTGREEEQKIINKQTIVAIENDDAADLIDISQFYTSGGFDRQNLQSQVAVINEYRGMAVHHEVDRAIDDIINEAVTSDADESPVDLVFKEASTYQKKLKNQFPMNGTISFIC